VPPNPIVPPNPTVPPNPVIPFTYVVELNFNGEVVQAIAFVGGGD